MKRVRNWVGRVAWTLLGTAVGFAFGSGIAGEQRLRHADVQEAAQDIVAWIVDGTPLPGDKTAWPYPLTEGPNPVIVVCGILSEDTILSANPRVRRPTREDAVRIFGREQGMAAFIGRTVEGADIINLSVTDANHSRMVVHVESFRVHCCGAEATIEFDRRLWGLRARVRGIALP